MIISHKYNLCFCHIPKNAGTFISSFLKFIDPNCIDVRNKGGLGHQTMSQIIHWQKHHKINDYLNFCAIRSPSEKICSSYNFYYHNIYDDFDSFLLNLDSVQSNSGHLANIPYICELNNNILPNIALINFDTITKDIALLFLSLGLAEEDFQKKIEDFSFLPQNNSNKIIKSLTEEHLNLSKKHDFIEEEFNFWEKFNSLSSKTRLVYSSDIFDF
jgi:hypothetical protein